jgi:hypothetical protein
MARRISGLLVLGLCLSSAHAAAQQATVLDRVVAVVDGEAIFLSDLQRAEAMLAARNARRSALEYLIDRALLARLAAREGTVNDEDVERAIRNVRHQVRFSEEDFWAAVESQGFTRESYRADVRRQLGVSSRSRPAPPAQRVARDARRGARPDPARADPRAPRTSGDRHPDLSRRCAVIAAARSCAQRIARE